MQLIDIQYFDFLQMPVVKVVKVVKLILIFLGIYKKSAFSLIMPNALIIGVTIFENSSSVI